MTCQKQDADASTSLINGDGLEVTDLRLSHLSWGTDMKACSWHDWKVQLLREKAWNMSEVKEMKVLDPKKDKEFFEQKTWISWQFYKK